MPEISRFYGIVISMYAGEHPPAHFHAQYAESQATFEIQTGELIKGDFPKPQTKMVQAWVEIHRKELLENFNLLQKDIAEYYKIDPLT